MICSLHTEGSAPLAHVPVCPLSSSVWAELTACHQSEDGAEPEQRNCPVCASVHCEHTRPRLVVFRSCHLAPCTGQLTFTTVTHCLYLLRVRRRDNLFWSLQRSCCTLSHGVTDEVPAVSSRKCGILTNTVGNDSFCPTQNVFT